VVINRKETGISASVCLIASEQAGFSYAIFLITDGATNVPASLGSGSGGRMTQAVGVGAIVGAGSSAAECATSLTNANVSAMTNVHQEGNR
jgi:hypothetical protein